MRRYRWWIVLVGALTLGPYAAPPTAQAVAPPVTDGIVFRAASSTTEPDASTVEAAAPGGTVAGDLLVAQVANRDHVGATLKAAGWSEAGSTHSAGLLKTWALYRLVGAAEPDTYAFTQDASSAMAVTISAYSGVDPKAPVDTFVGKVNGQSNTFTPPSVASAAGNEVAVWFGTQAWSGDACPDPGITLPEVFTSRLDSCAPGDGAGLTFALGDHQLGAAGPQPATLLAPADQPSWVGHSASAVTNLTQLLLLQPAAPVQVADAYGSGTVKVGSFSVPDSQLHEPSGLAASQVNAGVLYTHSEEDDKTMVAISATDASVLETFDLTNQGQWDWEDMAVAPCPAGSCLYAGDIGGNSSRGTRANDYNIFRVAEPAVVDGSGPTTLTTERYRFAYPDGRHNAEALLVDPGTQQIYVVTKVQSGASGVYTFPGPLPAPSDTTITTLTKVTTLQLPTYTAKSTSAAELHHAKWYAQVSGGSVHPAADRFLLRTPYAVWEFRGPAGGTLRAAMAAKPVALTAPVGEGQGEAVTYAPDGSSYYTLSERPAPPYTLHRIDRE